MTEPPSAHDLLVRAALSADPDAGAAAFERWRRRVDVEELDIAQQRLLPLLADRLAAAAAEDPVAERLRRISRFTWLRTQMLLSRTVPALGALGDAGIEVVLIKGAAVLQNTGLSPALRPMDDLDVLVPIDATLEAIAVVEEQGMRPFRPEPPGLDAPLFRLQNAINFDDGHGGGLDLHWHLLRGSRHPSASDGFLARARPGELRGVGCLILSPEDTLLNVVEHGHRWTRVPILRWVSDATLLIRACELDWDLVVATARDHRLGAVLGDSLAYLADAVEAPVPDAVLRTLRREHQTPTEWHRRHRRPPVPPDGGPCPPGRLGRALDAWEDHAQSSLRPGRRATPADIVRWLREMWLLDRSAAVPGHLAFVALGRPWRLRRLLGAHRRAASRHRDLPAYEPGTRLEFGYGDGNRYAVAGWEAPDPDGRWTRGGLGRLVLPLAEVPPGPWQLEAECEVLHTGFNREVEADVIVDGRNLDTWQFSGTLPSREHRVAELPGPAAGPVEILFVVRHPVIAADVRWPSDDPNQVGLRLFSLTLGPVPGEKPTEAGR